MRREEISRSQQTLSHTLEATSTEEVQRLQGEDPWRMQVIPQISLHMLQILLIHQLFYKRLKYNAEHARVTVAYQLSIQALHHGSPSVPLPLQNMAGRNMRQPIRMLPLGVPSYMEKELAQEHAWRCVSSVFAQRGTVINLREPMLYLMSRATDVWWDQSSLTSWTFKVVNFHTCWRRAGFKETAAWRCCGYVIVSWPEEKSSPTYTPCVQLDPQQPLRDADSWCSLSSQSPEEDCRWDTRSGFSSRHTPVAQ